MISILIISRVPTSRSQVRYIETTRTLYLILSLNFCLSLLKAFYFFLDRLLMYRRNSQDMKKEKTLITKEEKHSFSWYRTFQTMSRVFSICFKLLLRIKCSLPFLPIGPVLPMLPWSPMSPRSPLIPEKQSISFLYPEVLFHLRIWLIQDIYVK